ncbi:helix-turn-helix transcriptional regulator [Acinetobacter sp. XS-4]|uniref:ArsR/SmtB family transcription factor n=1 Tax=Acinetobacter sp. XS-4 TaxID=2923375 RepID=UPI00208F54B6|nr:helix-turn-helix transcriptional regulator [Acinetobacter sp. XS-4]USP42039.1 ArsR family transcriptional regulator [Acinetobacter sp. XS-4]
MPAYSNVISTAFLIADQTRMAMLVALLDGRSLPAGELARISGVTAQTASSHLTKLLEGGLISVEMEGRHRYYRLAGSHIAQILEYLAVVSPEVSGRTKVLSQKDRQLRFCRRCYDHLAGQVGVAITTALENHDYIRVVEDKQFIVTSSGIEWFSSIGLNVSLIKSSRRGLARQCLDWTERVHHLGGPLGVHLMNHLSVIGWLRYSKSSRAVQITQRGIVELNKQLGVDITSIDIIN